MAIGFRFNTSAFSKFIERAESALNPVNAGPVQDGLASASDVYMESQRRRFDRASHDDGTWAPLAESTVSQRLEEGESEPLAILHKSGELEASLRRGDQEHLLEFTYSGVQEGSANPIARFHQDGTDRMPARPILVAPTAETLSEMKTEEAVGISLAIREAGRG